MLSAHLPLMGAQQPALEQTRHVMNMREQRLEGDGGSRHDGDLRLSEGNNQMEDLRTATDAERIFEEAFNEMDE